MHIGDPVSSYTRGLHNCTITQDSRPCHDRSESNNGKSGGKSGRLLGDRCESWHVRGGRERPGGVPRLASFLSSKMYASNI